MFITLTNATPAHKGKPVAINSDSIVTINTDKVERQLDELTTLVEDVTFIFCPPYGTWEVSESISEITAILNGKKGLFK